MEEFERPPWAGTGEPGTVLVLPGGSGGVFQSAIYWITLGLADAGWDLLVARWDDQAAQEAQVQSRARDGLARIRDASVSLVLGKSLGSLAAPVIRDAAVRAIWLTPLLNRPEVADAIATAPAPALVVGGAADSTWLRPTDRKGLSVQELPSAGHGLTVAGDWRRSLVYTEEIVDRALAFAANHGTSRTSPA